MIKFYPRLHNTNNHFKKQFLSISLLLFLMLYIGTHANAQCPVVNVTPAISCGGVAGAGPCNLLTASGNADTYVWSPLVGLFTDCTHTIPYTGGNTTIVYAAPTSYTVYTVTGTITASGCSRTATAQVNYTPPPPVVTPNPAVMCMGGPAIKLKVVSATTTAQFCSGPINIPVPDNNPAGALNSILVSGTPPACIITGITVTINMQHTWIGDMVFALRAPSGNVINLDYRLSATGGNGATTGFVNTIISSLGTVALSAGTNPYTGTFRADLQIGPAAGPTGMIPTSANWASLLSSPNGNWTLGFYDGVTGDLGTLTSWCLGITYSCGIQATPAVWSPMAGLFSDPAAAIPYNGTPTDSVWARPTPAGTYTYSVTTQSLPVPPVAFTNPAPIVIPVGGPASAYPANLSVSGLGLPSAGVTIRSIVLHGVSHTRSNDIDVLLQSPTGQNVILMSDVGGINPINATYTFSDPGPAMSSTTANPSGTYKPTNFIGAVEPDQWPAPGPGGVSQPSPAISMFAGTFNGLWKLFVMDDDGTGDQGVISGGYTINFDIGVPACTSPPRYVVVTVGMPISITTQPVNTTICTDGVATFSVIATGGGTLSYQWQVSSNGSNYTNITNGGIYSGATTSTLTLTAPPVSMSGYYFRVLINGTAACASTTSAAAILTVNPLPNIVITANPLIIGPGETTTIFSTVTPNPAATYTWYYNGAVLPGATADTLLVDLNGLGDYQLKVTNVNGCTNLSNIITIAHSFALTLFTYPNPSAGIFQVRYYSEANSALQRSLTVYDNRGERILTRTFTQTIPYQKIDVDIRAHGKGLYWIELRDAGGKRLAINRIVIQ